MVDEIILKPFDRIMSGYKRINAETISVKAAAQLVRDYEALGIDRYSLFDFKGACYLNYYLECRVEQVPTLRYQRNFLIPLIFKNDLSAKRLFHERGRLDSFFDLLSWSLTYEPKKVLINYEEWAEAKKNHEPIIGVVDAAYLAFRLSAIIDGAGYPISHLQTVEQFVDWNRVFRLIDDGGEGRRRKIFDIENPKHESELQLILKMVQVRYPETKRFI